MDLFIEYFSNEFRGKNLEGQSTPYRASKFSPGTLNLIKERRKLTYPD